MARCAQYGRQQHKEIVNRDNESGNSLVPRSAYLLKLMYILGVADRQEELQRRGARGGGWFDYIHLFQY
jgi:hypothetical protein